MNLFPLKIVNDDTRAKKSDARDDSFNHARSFGHAPLGNGKNDQRRTDPDQTERSHASRLAMQITVETKRSAQHGGASETKRDVECFHDGTVERQPMNAKNLAVHLMLIRLVGLANIPPSHPKWGREHIDQVGGMVYILRQFLPARPEPASR